MAELPEEKPVEWRGSSHDDMLAQQETIQDRLGYQLNRVQLGLLPSDYRPMNTVGSGAYEIRVKDEDGIARLMYVAKFGDVVNVLPCVYEEDSADVQGGHRSGEKAI